MEIQNRIPKQLLTPKQVKEILKIKDTKLNSLDSILKPIRMSTRGDRRYDSDKVYDFMEKGIK